MTNPTEKKGKNSEWTIRKEICRAYKYKRCSIFLLKIIFLKIKMTIFPIRPKKFILASVWIYVYSHDPTVSLPDAGSSWLLSQVCVQGFWLQHGNKNLERRNPRAYQIGTGLISHGRSIWHDAMYALNELVGSVFIR